MGGHTSFSDLKLANSDPKPEPGFVTINSNRQGQMAVRSRNHSAVSINTPAVEVEHGARRDHRKYTSKNKTSPSSISNGNTPQTDPSTPHDFDKDTPVVIRGSLDLRSPGMPSTPSMDILENAQKRTVPTVPDLITQTDRYGHTITPHFPDPSTRAYDIANVSEEDDACDVLLEGMRMMCCCLLPSTTDMLMKDPLDESHRRKSVSVLPPILEKDTGKKCLVLDLDETLVHSSFRVVNEADFVIPVQIDNVLHYVYVVKRPGVDRFLAEMAIYYEIIIYTASLNKYADPLLDLLDPGKTIGARLFRDSCVYHEGNYVKDLSLLNRDLQRTIIVDNSPSSYVFHPENAIDCISFIDDRADRELYRIAEFLTAVKDVRDVRDVCAKWRQWPFSGEQKEGREASVTSTTNSNHVLQ